MATYKLTSLNQIIYRSRLIFQQNGLSAIRYYASSSGGAAAVKKSPKSSLRLLLIGMGVGGLVGSGYSGYVSYTKSRVFSDVGMQTQAQPPHIIEKLPDIKFTRKVINPKDQTNLDLVLFQFQTCPFCCKVRAYLDSQGFSYSVVEVDAVLRQSLKWSPYKKVPMLLARRRDGKYIQLTDSSMIISTLASFLTNPSQDIGELVKFYPNITYLDENGSKQSDVVNKYFLMYQDELPGNSSKQQIEEERKWRSWCDSHLVHLISPNVYRNSTEALETFEWFSDVGEWDVHFPRWERNLMVYVGAMAMWAISKRLKKRHGLSDDVRWHLYNACDKWTSEIEKKSTTFMGGKKPNLADLTVFGVLNSMEGCQAFADCLENTNIGPWFYAIKAFVQQNKGTVISPIDDSTIEQMPTNELV